MKNVTVSMEVDVARWARIKAAEHDRSLSKYLGDVLAVQMRREKSYEAAMTRYFERDAHPMGDTPPLVPNPKKGSS